MKINQYLSGQSRSRILALTLFLLVGCAGLTPDEQQAKRMELDEMGDETVLRLIESNPDVQAVLDQSAGYAVVDMAVAKVPVLGGGGGYAIILDKRSGNRSYAKVTQFEIGGGLGAKKYKVVVFFEDEKLLDRAIKGAWHFEAGAEAAAGSVGAEGVAKTSKGYRAYKIAEGGAAATVTVRVARAKPYLQ